SPLTLLARAPEAHGITPPAAVCRLRGLSWPGPLSKVQLMRGKPVVCLPRQTNRICWTPTGTSSRSPTYSSRLELFLLQSKASILRKSWLGASGISGRRLIKLQRQLQGQELTTASRTRNLFLAAAI